MPEIQSLDIESYIVRRRVERNKAVRAFFGAPLSRLDLAFIEFHEANPLVYEKFVELARKAKRAGRTRVGAKAIAEVLRWEMNLAAVGDDRRINNNNVSRYARVAMALEPDLAGLFELRELKS